MAGKKPGAPRFDAKRPDVEGLPAKRSGPDPWAPTQQQSEQIKSLAARGVGLREISAIIGIDKDTLALRCNRELEDGRALGVATITGKLFEQAKSGSYKHQALYLGHVAKWSQRVAHEHSGEGGGPIGITILTAVPEPEADE